MLERIAFMVKTDRRGVAKQVTPVVPDISTDERRLIARVLKNKIQYFKTGRPMYMTNISIYSLTRPIMAAAMAKFISDYVNNPEAKILDATANVGGMSLYLVKYFKHVTSMEYDQLTSELLRQNMAGTGAIVKHGDALKEIKRSKYNVIFFDPPWGGTNDVTELRLGGKTMRAVIRSIPKRTVVALLIPPKFDFASLGDLPYVMWHDAKLGMSNRLVIIDRN